MLTAIGASGRFERSNFPLPASAYPFGLQLTLEPFSRDTIERFVCYEMPSAGVLSAEQEGVYASIRARVLASRGSDTDRSGGGSAPLRIDAVEGGTGSEPFEVVFGPSASSITRSKRGLRPFRRRAVHRTTEAQANARFVPPSGDSFDGSDISVAAIDMIIEQGEAPTAAHPDAHFVIFDTIRRSSSRPVAAAREGALSSSPFAPSSPIR